MEVDRISYIFGSFTRRRQSQEMGSAKRRSIEPPKISHDRSNSTPHTSKRNNDQPSHRTKSVYDVPFDENRFRCPLCQRYYVEPRVLPCLHTFCIRCLREMEARNCVSLDKNSDGSLNDKTTSNSGESPTEPEPTGSVVDKHSPHKTSPSSSKVAKGFCCPTCGTVSHLPPDGVSAFPLNYLLQHRLVLATLSANATRLLCDLCPSDVPAATRCLDCATSLCLHCAETHQRQKGFAHHQLQSVEEVQKNGITNVQRQIMCNVHPDEELSIFCSTCYQVVCRYCASATHKEHSCETASKAAKSFVTDLRVAVDKAKLAAESSAMMLARLQAASKRVEMKCSQVQADVERFMVEYIKAIDQHRRNLYEQIHQTKTQKRLRIEKRRNELQNRMKNAKDATAFIDELLNEGTDVEVLSFAKHVLKKLESCTGNESTDLSISDSMQFLPTEIVQNSGSCCPLYGVITTQTVSPKHCNLNTEGLAAIRVGKKVELVLETCDNNGDPLERGGEPVKAEVLHRNGGIARDITVHINDLRNGKYLLSFIPDFIGKLILNVYVKGQPIKGCPFPVNVRSLKLHQGIFHCCSFCSSNGNKEATCGCGGKMPGGYKGCGHGHDGHPGRRHWSCCGNIIEHSECIRINSTHYQFTL